MGPPSPGHRTSSQDVLPAQPLLGKASLNSLQRTPAPHLSPSTRPEVTHLPRPGDSHPGPLRPFWDSSLWLVTAGTHPLLSARCIAFAHRKPALQSLAQLRSLRAWGKKDGRKGVTPPQPGPGGGENIVSWLQTQTPDSGRSRKGRRPAPQSEGCAQHRRHRPGQ